MDKNVLKKYAVWARRELIVRVGQRATFYGVTEEDYGDVSAESINGRILSDMEKKQRKALIAQIRKKGYEEVIEEVSYTWFNRFLALRFMEVNGYLPDRVKIFTDSNNRFQPQILNEAIDLEIVGLDMEKVYAYKDANQTEELYKYLLVVQCNALNAVLPGMFQKIEDYTELLLPDKLLLEGSVIERMIALIPEEDWKDAVQIIGWMYQYYNSEKKDEVFAALKKNVKITKENIPAATQLFTPDWIVRYMVENSLGRLWVEGHPNEELKSNWKYYLEEAEQESEVEAELAKIRAEYAQLTPKAIRCIDPCQGSGHILVYMFDVLMQIYESYGYTTQEAVASIVKNNIYGLDIDERAAQLSYFAVMMKACQYDKRFLKRKDEDGKPKVPQPRVYAIQESNDVDSHVLEYFCNGNVELKEAMGTIMEEMHDAKEYGSIITVTEQNWDVIYARFEEIREDISIHKEGALELLPLVQVAQSLAQKYDVVVTNPPYLALSSAMPKLYTKMKNDFSDSRNDLYAVFINKCNNLVRKYGMYAMITQHTWMFLSRSSELRNKMLQLDIINMVHLGTRAFEEIGGEVVQTVAFVFRNCNTKYYLSKFVRLVDYLGQEDKRVAFLNGTDRYTRSKEVFDNIPGRMYIYWQSNIFMKNFEKQLVREKINTRVGLDTGNNDKYIRTWSEVYFNKIKFDAKVAEDVRAPVKWVPHTKGGSYRKWYGNFDHVLAFDEINYNELLNMGNHLPSRQFYFQKGITWSRISTNDFAVRYTPAGMVFNSACPTAFAEDDILIYALGLLNSKIVNVYVTALSPTMNFQAGDIDKVPFILSEKDTKSICKLVKNCIKLSKDDYDSYETAWDFRQHPLVELRTKSKERINEEESLYHIEDAFFWWNNECEVRFEELKFNEEELNRFFIDIYGLQDELTPEVEDKDVTVRKADLQCDIKSLISYAVGCMFGRYSLYVPGIVYAGGEWPPEEKAIGVREKYFPDADSDICSCTDAYGTYMPDLDNVIPITDDEYFENDIVEKFVEFIRTVYGEKTLEENLKFIADVLGGKGQPREVIRNYFLNDFYKNHCKIYQKRPIYWLFDSGKKNGFKCLIYMHRYEPDTIARIRTDYVHEQQSRYRTAIADLEQRIANAGTSERVKLNKSLKKIQEQADELHTYEEKIHHLADQMIAIDLDNGVKHNYEIFKDVLAKIK